MQYREHSPIDDYKCFTQIPFIRIASDNNANYYRILNIIHSAMGGLRFSSV